MRRRDFITLLSGGVLLPQMARAQSSSRIPHLGFLGVTVSSSWAGRLEALRSGLRRLGYEKDKNILALSQGSWWAEEQYDRLPALAAELLVARSILFSTYGTPGTLAAKRATTDIPIVFVYAGDAVGAGLVTNLSAPEANVTGNTYFLPESLMAKRLELLKDTIPHIRRVAVLVKPDNPLFSATLPLIHRAADTLKIELQEFDARDPSDFFQLAIAAMVRNRIEGILVQEDAVYLTNQRADRRSGHQAIAAYRLIR